MHTLFRKFCRILVAVVLAVFPVTVRAQNIVTITSPSYTSLANAINFNVGGQVTIVLAFNGTITFTAPLDVECDVVLDATGHNVTFSGNNSQTAFFIDSGEQFSATNVVFANFK